MKKTILLAAVSLALPWLAIALPSGNAFGQTKFKKEQLVGTWTYVSLVGVRPDGTKGEPWGSNPVGQVIFTSNGRYSLQLIKPDLPKLRNRAVGSPEENAAIVQGVFSHYGSYTVNEEEGTYTLHIEACSLAIFNGTEQPRTVTAVSPDELKTTNVTTSTGVTNLLVYKRVR